MGIRRVILYHIARLAALGGVPELAKRRETLVQALRQQAAHTADSMGRLLLSTSLMRLGAEPLLNAYPSDAALDAFCFFAGSIFTPIDNPITWALARRAFFQVRLPVPRPYVSPPVGARSVLDACPEAASTFGR